MKKSPEAFRTISEVADWLGTPTHVLRFWESRFAQVKPVKRAGGRRYYRPSDMALLGGIKKLLHDDGMTIRGVQKLLREEGVKHVASLSPMVDGAGLIDDQDTVEATPVPPQTAQEAPGKPETPAAAGPEATAENDLFADIAGDEAENAAAKAPEIATPPSPASPAQEEPPLAEPVAETSEPPAPDLPAETPAAQTPVAAQDTATEGGGTEAPDSDARNAVPDEAPFHEDAPAPPTQNVVHLGADVVARERQPDAGPNDTAPHDPAPGQPVHQNDAAAPAPAETPRPLIADVPDDPEDDSVMPGIADVALSLRNAARRAPQQKPPPPEVFGELYERLIRLRARMDEDSDSGASG